VAAATRLKPSNAATISSRAEPTAASADHSGRRALITCATRPGVRPAAAATSVRVGHRCSGNLPASSGSPSVLRVSSGPVLSRREGFGISRAASWSRVSSSVPAAGGTSSRAGAEFAASGRRHCAARDTSSERVVLGSPRARHSA
jgi:hypothetical protein